MALNKASGNRLARVDRLHKDGTYEAQRLIVGRDGVKPPT
jgi:hypothetical protein